MAGVSVRVCVLDVNETLFSLGVVGDAFEGVGLGRERVGGWFDRVLRDGFAASLAGTPAAFADLARHHVRRLCSEAGRPATDADVAQVVAAFDAVEAHPDVIRGVTGMRDAGLRVVAYTNGSAQAVEGFLARAGLTDVAEALRREFPAQWAGNSRDEASAGPTSGR